MSFKSFARKRIIRPTKAVISYTNKIEGTKKQKAAYFRPIKSSGYKKRKSTNDDYFSNDSYYRI